MVSRCVYIRTRYARACGMCRCRVLLLLVPDGDVELLLSLEDEVLPLSLRKVVEANQDNLQGEEITKHTDTRVGETVHETVL